jgi:hypothetical protein
MFTLVTYTLALIRLRLAGCTDIRSYLTDLLLVYAVYDYLVGGGNIKGDAFGLLELNGMRITQVENQLVSLLLGTVADANYLKRLGIAVGNAYDHVVDKGTGQAVKGSVLLHVVRAGNVQNAVIHGNMHLGRDLLGKFALGALYDNGVIVANRDCHSARNVDRKFSDS